MYARVATIQFRPDKTAEANHIVLTSIAPILKEQKGFGGQLFLIQSDTDKAISINLWETEAEMTSFESSSLYRELLGNLKDVLAGPPASERYEVGVLLGGL